MFPDCLVLNDLDAMAGVNLSSRSLQWFSVLRRCGVGEVSFPERKRPGQRLLNKHNSA